MLAGCSTPAPSAEAPDSSVAPDANDDAPAWVDGEDERCFSEAYAPGPKDDCGQCQIENCCTEYFQCYDDKACYWADYLFDHCVEGDFDAGVDASDAWGDAGDGGIDCWAIFIEKSGTYGQALNTCIDKYCSTRCNL